MFRVLVLGKDMVGIGQEVAGKEAHQVVEGVAALTPNPSPTGANLYPQFLGELW